MATKTEMASASPLDLVRNSALAVELAGDECSVLADLVTVRDLADGEVLINEGESDNHIHVIASGALNVVRQSDPSGKPIYLYMLNAGDLVGELAFMDGKPHYAALIANGPTRIFSLEREKLESLLERHPHVVYHVMRAIFRVVHGILHRMGYQNSELMNYIYKQHGKY